MLYEQSVFESGKEFYVISHTSSICGLNRTQGKRPLHPWDMMFLLWKMNTLRRLLDISHESNS